MIRYTLVVALALCASQAQAQSKLSDVKKASEFSASCQPSALEVQKSYLAGFVTGAADASVGKHICPKEAVSTQQLVDTFCGYLKAHPKNLNRPGGLLLGLALSEAWPCKQ
ncbi:Rap1a/Tai family immunity protein [Methylobacterium sp. CM6257]